MSVEKENLGRNRVRLTVTVPPEIFRENIDKAYRKEKSKYSMPGFRKGNVPRSVIEASNGPETFFGTALELLLPESLQKAYEEAGIEVVSDADITSVQSASRETGVTYVVEVDVMPEVELGQYQDLTAEEQYYAIRDEDVDREIERVRREGVRWIPVERAAQNGDTVTIDYVGKVDDTPFEGGSSENFRVELGSELLIPGFEDGLLGALTGEDRLVEITFPPDYAEPSLVGKPAVFEVHVNEVAEPELPELDDDFAQDVSSCDTLAEYREEVRKNLQQAMDMSMEADVEAQIVTQILNNSSADIPQSMIDKEAEKQVMRTQMKLGQKGISLDTYMRLRGIDRNALIEEAKGYAQSSILKTLVLLKLMEVLNAEASDEQIDAELQKMADRKGDSLENVSAQTSDEQRMALKERLSYANLLKKLKSISNINRVVVDSLDQIHNVTEQAEGAGESESVDGVQMEGQN